MFLEKEEKLYSDEVYCTKELLLARGFISSLDIMNDDEKVLAIKKALGLMYSFCPSSLKSIVLSTMMEFDERLFLIKGKNIGV